MPTNNTEAEFQDTVRLLRMLRAESVRRYVAKPNGELEVEFHTPTPAKQTIEVGDTKSDTENCRCGHPEFEHTNAGCLRGCDLDKCVEPDEAAAQ